MHTLYLLRSAFNSEMSREIIYIISRQNGDVAEATVTVDAAADACGRLIGQ